MGKLTYEQLRLIATGAPDGGKLVIKNRQGVILRPKIKKWGHPPQETKSMSTEGLLRPSHASMAHPSLTCHPASYLRPRRPVGRR